jgi:glucose/mannose-6-phosphate isomerase
MSPPPDRGDMLAQAGALGDQLRAPIADGLLRDRGPFTDVLLAGLGGSAAGARLAVALLEAELRMPVAIAASTPLPHWVGPSTLAVVTSYSGATAEALDWWAQAGQCGATRVAVTSGGRLGDDAAAAGEPLILVGAGYEPRGALGLLLAPLVVLLEEAGAAPGATAMLAPAAAAADRVRDAMGAGTDGGAARHAAERLADVGIVLYGAGVLGAVAVRLKNQLNENAKAPAFAGSLPEVAHNEVLGWTGARALGLPLAAVVLRDADETAAERAVADGVAEELAAEGHRVLQWAGEGATAAERAFWLLAFGDHVSCYLGERLGVDLGDIGRLRRLKARVESVLAAPPRSP